MNNERQNKEPFIVFGSPLIETQEIEEIVKVMRSGWIGTGPRVSQFEHDFAKFKNVQHVAAVNSCTAALHLSMLAAKLEQGDEVITTPLTFCATINSIIHAGAVPVLADINPKTLNIDPDQIQAKISPKTKAIIPVHFAGRPCEMDLICECAQKNSLTIIEDCAHAIESKYHGRNVGTFGDFACFSFYVTKNVITGEGGMVIASSKADIETIKVLALHGMSKDAWKRFSDNGYVHYTVIDCGYKYNMMDIQAAIGIHQLKRVNRNHELRRLIWERYNNEFKNLPIGIPMEPAHDTCHGYHLYTLIIDEKKTGLSRDEFMNKIAGYNIGTGVHYLSIPEHPYYQQRFSWRPEDYPNAMKIGRQTVSIPLSPKLSNENIDHIIMAVKKILNR